MSATETVDAARIEAAIRGDREAVGAITQAFLPRVFGLAMRLTRNRELAEDATQETFVRALRALPQLRDHDRFKSWILTITANTAREILRKQARNPALDYEPAAIEADVDERLEVRKKALDLAVADLSDPERELFLLHTVEGLKLKDLAAQLETTVPAMKSRVHRIRSKIRVSALAHMRAAGATTA
jgi:RNA polymerase sigma-70 factor (ECF subfamily)